jgi:dolichol-phosphate mannosyltransferase
VDLKNKRDSSETKTTEVCFVLPTYNEEKNIRQTVEGIFSNQILFPTHRLRVLVVDDNSSDGTQKKVTQLITKYPDLHMITGDKKGLGDAYKRGFLHALSFFKPDFVFQMDSDGQHDPKLIPAFIEQINAGYSLVVGSRFTEGGSLTDLEIHRKFIAWLGNFLVRYAGGVRHRPYHQRIACVNLLYKSRY